MNSLWQRAATHAVVDGAEVDADHRTVLRCLRALWDEALDDAHKAYLISRWFYKGKPQKDPIGGFTRFLSQTATDDPEPPVIDLEQDADAIYVSFYQAYGLDLLNVPFLHWRVFLTLLRGLGEDTALGRRVWLRTLDVSSLPESERPRMLQLQAQVQLKPRLTRRERELAHELDRALSSGEGVGEALHRMQKEGMYE